MRLCSRRGSDGNGFAKPAGRPHCRRFSSPCKRQRPAVERQAGRRLSRLPCASGILLHARCQAGQPAQPWVQRDPAEGAAAAKTKPDEANDRSRPVAIPPHCLGAPRCRSLSTVALKAAPARAGLFGSLSGS